MSYSIIPTQRFEKELKRLAKKHFSLKAEFAQLIADISENPETGVYIGNHCYKILVQRYIPHYLALTVERNCISALNF